MFLSLLGTGTSEMSAKSDFREQTIHALVSERISSASLPLCVCVFRWRFVAAVGV